MKITTTDSMIQFEYDEAMLQVIQAALGNLKDQSRQVLKIAVNATAKQAKRWRPDQRRFW